MFVIFTQSQLLIYQSEWQFNIDREVLEKFGTLHTPAYFATDGLIELFPRLQLEEQA